MLEMICIQGASLDLDGTIRNGHCVPHRQSEAAVLCGTAWYTVGTQLKAAIFIATLFQYLKDLLENIRTHILMKAFRCPKDNHIKYFILFF